MQALYFCATEQHDFRLLGLSAFICTLAVYTAFALCREALRVRDEHSALVWTCASIVAATSAIWATHFIAMLAFQPGFAFGFDAMRTIQSFVVALLMMSAVVVIATRGPRTRTTFLLAGGVAGLTISAMHYTGMSALQAPAQVAWSWRAVAASIGSGLLFSMLSAVAVRSPLPRLRLLAPPCFVAAILLDHLFGMSALRLAFDPTVGVMPEGASKGLVGQIVANVALVIAALSGAALWLTTRDRRRFAAEEIRLRDLADIAVEGLIICRGDEIVSVNRSLEQTLQCTEDKLIGRRIGDVLPGIDASTVPLKHETSAILQYATEEAVPVRVVGQNILLGNKPHLVVAVRDQRERLDNEERMLRLARQDALTDIANRLSFNEILSERLHGRDARKGELALLTLDLDHFKAVNDTFGHAMGDDLLRRVAGRLKQAVQTTDHLARLGGDEFAIVVDTADGLARVREIAEHVTDLLSRPFMIDGQVIEIAASVGIALSPSDGSDPITLSRNADLALYRAKQDGGNCYRLFEADMNARMQARRSIEADLRRALLRHEFELHYQPLVDARSSAFNGAEALVRWRHPSRGLVSPADFIPLAEEIGLIGSLGEWVLRTACAEAATWPEHLSVAVNMSPLQFRDPRLAISVAAILAETGLPGHRLELEVTESVLMHDGDNTAALLHELRALGVRISMDDFGTGYSSLSYLRRFPFDKIKIDQSFARQTPTDRDSVAIVQAIVSLGAKLGMTVTVEGVETPEQQAFMIAEGCDQIQGYLISKPVPVEQVRALFQTAPVSAAA